MPKCSSWATGVYGPGTQLRDLKSDDIEKGDFPTMRKQRNGVAGVFHIAYERLDLYSCLYERTKADRRKKPCRRGLLPRPWYEQIHPTGGGQRRENACVAGVYDANREMPWLSERGCQAFKEQYLPRHLFAIILSPGFTPRNPWLSVVDVEQRI